MAEETEGGTAKNIKIWKATPDSKSGFMTTETEAVMVGGEKSFIAVNKEAVTIMSKSIGFGTVSENIRKGGLFVEMNDLVKMVPSSVVTPQPSQVPYPPLGLAKQIVKDLPIFLSFLG